MCVCVCMCDMCMWCVHWISLISFSLINLRAHVCTCECSFPGGKYRLCSSGCHWFIDLNVLISCPAEWVRERGGAKQNAIDRSIDLSVYVCEPESMNIAAINQVVEKISEFRCAIGIEVFARHITGRRYTTLFPFLVCSQNGKFTYISICARLIEEWIRRDKCDKWMGSKAENGKA